MAMFGSLLATGHSVMSQKDIKSTDSEFRSYLLTDGVAVINEMQRVVAEAQLLESEINGYQAAGTPSEPLVSMPQLVVIGAQSVGKSSLLESIVGREFIPKGLGMVTKCPLIIQMVNNKTATTPPFVQFHHIPKVSFTTDAEIKEEIMKQSDVLCAASSYRDVSSVPIVLTYNANDILDLTLIDTPGLVRVPTGNQPQDLPKKIEEMVEKCVSDPATIIVAVSAANVDLANSDALNIARKVDPEGRRTIGVLTKCDVVESPQLLCDIMEGTVYNLKHGYTLVRCRSQDDLKNGITIPAGYGVEEKYFSHQAFSFYRDRCGIKNLSSRLQQLLFQHVAHELPQIKRKLMTTHKELDQKLKDLGCEINPKDSHHIVANCINNYARNFESILDGTGYCQYLERMEDVHKKDSGVTRTLEGGARLKWLFHVWFGASVLAFDCLSGLTDDEIKNVIVNSSGVKGTLLMPEGAFDILAKRQIKKLEPCCVSVTNQVAVELGIILNYNYVEEFRRFPQLQAAIRKVAHKTLETCQPIALQRVRSLIDMEMAYINKTHPDFLGGKSPFLESFRTTNETTSTRNVCHVGQPDSTGGNSGLGKAYSLHRNVSSVSAMGDSSKLEEPGKRKPVPSNNENRPIGNVGSEGKMVVGGTNQDKFKLRLLPTLWEYKDIQEQYALSCGGDEAPTPMSDCATVKLLLSSYFEIVKLNIADMVPKTIMCFLVNELRKSLQQELLYHLYHDGTPVVLLKEEQSVTTLRATLTRKLKFVRELRKTFELTSQNIKSISQDSEDVAACLDGILKLEFGNEYPEFSDTLECMEFPKMN